MHVKCDQMHEIQRNEQTMCFSELLGQLHQFTAKKDLKYTISECLLDQVYENIIRNEGKVYENNGFVQTELA